MSSDAESRYDRERAFHNQRFDEANDERAADRFYVVNTACGAHYQRLIHRFEPGARILEYGCGTGGAAFDLAAEGAEVTAIDISDVAVEAARRQAEARGVSATFAVMNAEALDLEDGSFDLVCGSGILHHLDLERACTEVARVLRDDGRAVFAEPWGHNPVINLYRRATPGMRTDDEHPLVVTDWDVFERHFAEVRSESYALTALAAVPFSGSARVDRIVEPLNRLDRALFTRIPYLARHAWTVVIELGSPRR